MLRQSGTGFYIPLYQRPYRWNEDDVLRLICDLTEGIQRLDKSPRSSTFLGTLITVDDDDISPPAINLPAAVRQIIDGQQRIATYLCLLGELNRAITHNITGQPIPPPLQSRVKDIQQKLSDSLTFLLYDNDDYRLPRMIRGGYDTWGRVGGRYSSDIAEYLSKYDPAHSPSKNDTTQFGVVISSMGQILDANVFCSASSPSLVASGRDLLFGDLEAKALSDAPFQRLLALLVLAVYTLERVYVIHVQGLDQASASSVFESLNTTGELLTAFETFVPLVVSGTGGQAKYVGSTEARHLGRFEDLIKGLKSKEVAQRTRRALVGFALSETGEKIGEQLYHQRRYLRQYRTLPQPMQKQFVKGLGSCAECLRRLWFHQDGDHSWSRRTLVAMQMLTKSNHTVCQGLLIRGYEEFQRDSSEQMQRLVRLIAAFWLLWRLSRYGTDQVDDHHRGLMRGLDVRGRFVGPYCRRPRVHGSRVPDPGAVAEDLRYILERRGKIADRASWIAKATQISHGSRLNKALLRYAILGGYHDTTMANSKDQFLTQGAKGCSPTLTPRWWDSELTIEHIAPQSQRSDDDSYDSRLYQEGRIHHLGNLTLLPQYENRILSGKSWPAKRQYFQVYSERSTALRREELGDLDLRARTVQLLTDRFVPFCGDLAQCDAEQWDSEHVERRGQVLAEMIWDRFWPSLNPLSR